MIFASTRIILSGLELRALLAYSKNAAPAFAGICVDIDGQVAWSGDGTKSLTCRPTMPRPLALRRHPPLRIPQDAAKAASHFDAAAFTLHQIGTNRQLLWRAFIGDEAKALQVRPDAAKSIASGIVDCEVVPPQICDEDRELASSCTIDPRALQPIGILRSLGVAEVRVYMHLDGCPLSAIGESDDCRWTAECAAPTLRKAKKR